MTKNKCVGERGNGCKPRLSLRTECTERPDERCGPTAGIILGLWETFIQSVNSRHLRVKAGVTSGKLITNGPCRVSRGRNRHSPKVKSQEDVIRKGRATNDDNIWGSPQMDASSQFRRHHVSIVITLRVSSVWWPCKVVVSRKSRYEVGFARGFGIGDLELQARCSR